MDALNVNAYTHIDIFLHIFKLKLLGELIKAKSRFTINIHELNEEESFLRSN
jgi:hypothetical protein